MCGIFGVYGHKHASALTHLGLYALQHRGQESAGIVVSDGKQVKSYKGLGLVAEVFDRETINKLSGEISIGHVRYSTTGSPLLKNAQPFSVRYQGGIIAIAHNGNLVNAAELRAALEKSGSIFQSTMDSEVIMHLMARSNKMKFVDRVIEALKQIKGAYSLFIMNEKQLIAARDPFGWRPLCLGKLEGSFVLASETCALDLIRARYLRDIEPGEVLIIDEKGLRSSKPFPPTKRAFCIFEYIYFARPDSSIFGHSVYFTRKRLGNRLAEEFPANADLVMPVPDSGNYAALGFAEKSGLPFEMGMVRNHYIGRTFIQPAQSIRDFGVKVKLNPVKEVLHGKRIVIVEDSIVRGTTSRSRIRTLREAGAREVHMRVSCPPIKYPCFYGIDFPTPQELIAPGRTIDQIREYLGLDSLAYLSLEGMLESMLLEGESFCTACFTGKYPISAPQKMDKTGFEK